MGYECQNKFDTPWVYEVILPPTQRIVQLLEPEPFKYNALYIIRNHLYIDLKSEYVMEEEPSTLCAALQTRYEQKKAVICLVVIL
jgi:hypothetical protein